MTHKMIAAAPIITSCISAWCLTGTASVLKNPYPFTQLEFMREQNFILLLGSFIILTAILIFAAFKIKDFDKQILFFSSFPYSFVCIAKSRSINIYIGFIFFMAVVVYYTSDSILRVQKLSNRGTFTLIGMLAAFFVIFTGGLTTLRYLSYSAPGFDFGIFAQMFEYMKETGLPYTTCERNVLLSHFAVHLSPIYYLMLPFYLLFPSPVTLQLLQAIIAASGLIPLYLLCRHYKFSNKMTVAAAAIYAFYPGIAAACFYDFHENVFLAPLILWLLYSFEKDRKKLLWLFAALLLLVKEDAAVYAVAIGLYFWASGKSRKKGIALLAVSAAYFALSVFILSAFGQGVMSSRFNNFMFESGDLFTVIKSIFLNPAYLVSEVTKSEKHEFFIQMLMPLGFIPLISKRFSQYVLLIPFLLINMMPAYLYQHSIGYQYTFGTGALFFYLFIINLNDWKGKAKRTILLICATAAVLAFALTSLGELFYFDLYKVNREDYNKLNEIISRIPEDSSVAAGTFLIAHLNEHKELYYLPYINETDYVLLDLRYGQDGERLNEYETGDYDKVEHVEGLIAVFKSK